MKLEMHIEVLVPDVQAWIISSTDGEAFCASDADGVGHFLLRGTVRVSSLGSLPTIAWHASR